MENFHLHGLDKLKAELTNLKSVERQRLSARLPKHASMAISRESEYPQRERQSFIEGRSPSWKSNQPPRW